MGQTKEIVGFKFWDILLLTSLAVSTTGQILSTQSTSHLQPPGSEGLSFLPC